MWNDIEGGSVGLLGRNKNIRERTNVQRVPDSYDIIDTANNPVRGPPAKNCTGSGCCIPKCFAEKGNRGLPGVPGYPGPKGEWKTIFSKFFYLDLYIKKMLNYQTKIIAQ